MKSQEKEPHPAARQAGDGIQWRNDNGPRDRESIARPADQVF